MGAVYLNGTGSFHGFIVHAYPDQGQDRLYCVGRLADHRSFAAVEERWRPYIHIFKKDRDRALPLLSGLGFEETEADLTAFSGVEPLRRLRFFRFGGRFHAAALLEKAAIPSPDAGIKPADLFLMEKYIRGPAFVQGRVTPGRRVDVVIRDAEFSAPEPGDISAGKIPLRAASIDIETEVKSGLIRAVGIAWTDELAGSVAANAAGTAPKEPVINGIVRVLALGENNDDNAVHVFFHPDERSLLSAFIEDVRRVDPDVLTGWNFLDFDFPRLAERCGRLAIPFTLGRSSEPAKFLPGDSAADGSWQRRRRSAAAIVPGRQALDALRIARAGTFGGADLGGRGDGSGFTLEAVSRVVLGEGKIVHSSGEEKIAELDRLYAGDPRRFGEYCLRDAELVLRILAKTGLFRLTLERATLTGVSLDKAWTSVVSFERVYGAELRRRGIAPPPPDSTADVSGAAGGTVLDPLPGLFDNVAVFDFRSLYPTIMRTFNIDPLAHARAKEHELPVVAPNGAAFSREPGPLPSLIAEYFAARRLALDAGDSIAAQVYKILMNSFYGVLGTGACRYGRTKLAGAITSFARKWLHFSRDWFIARNFRVLYGDTDSLFVETGFGDGASYAVFEERCGSFAKELNRCITEKIREEYDLESFIELRFEKAYRRFLIPPLRSFHGTAPAGGAETENGNRGRAKGYGGYLISPADGAAAVEVKGMEAVRSDSTPLARRLQLELLELVFSGNGEGAFRERLKKILEDLRAGRLDDELVYRKRLTRYPESYTSSTPPQVKAARALGWKKKRGMVEYLWTLNGPEPLALPHGKPDYDHYAESQIFPLARSIAAAAHWDANFLIDGRDAAREGQMELRFR
jgi:DNA polymerase-2